MKHNKFELLFYVFFLILTCIEILLIIWTCTKPYDATTETVESFVANLWAVMFIGGMPLLNITAVIINKRDKNTGMLKYSLFILIYFGIIIVNIVTGSVRAHIRNGLKLEFSGTVIKKYRDQNNHNFQVLIIKESSEVRLEFFSNEFWNMVQIGDSITKNQWCPYAEINQRKFYYLEYFVTTK